MISKDAEFVCKICGKKVLYFELGDNICKSCKQKKKNSLNEIIIPKWLNNSGIIILILALFFMNGMIFLSFLVGIWCARRAYRLAKKSKLNGVVPFFVGLFFNLIGLAIFEIYYGMKKKSQKRETKEEKLNRRMGIVIEKKKEVKMNKTKITEKKKHPSWKYFDD